MSQKLSNPRSGASLGVFSRSLRQSVALVASLALVLAPAVWAADGRTVLKPGWNMFSPQQDVEIGQEVAREAERQLPMLNDSRVDNYVNRLGQRLAAKAPGEKYPYQYKVVNDRTINAFALPGGPIYINRGVIEAAENESQLAGVIAHETAHVALRHGSNQASKASAAQLPLAILGGMLGNGSTKGMVAQLGASFALNSVLLKYSRAAESQADILGTQILFDAGYDPHAMAEFFETVETAQSGSGPVEFFSNHPSPENRIARVNQEVAALGGMRTVARSSSREFDEIKRYLQSLPLSRGQLRQTGGQRSAPVLRIVSARYGANNNFIDVLQRIQSRVQNDRLEMRVNNSSMGGNPTTQVKTLQLRYQWGNQTYDLTVQENQQFSIPTPQQISNSGGEIDSSPGGATERFVGVEHSLLRILHPESWKAYGQGDALTLAPANGLVADANGNQALVLGVIVNIFEPRWDGYNRQMQGPGIGQGSAQDSARRLDESTDLLVQELRLSNRNMRVIRYREVIRVDGERALSTYLSNESPLGGRETDWLVTVERPDGLLYIVFAAPEREFQAYEGAFHEMLRSVRLRR